MAGIGFINSNLNQLSSIASVSTIQCCNLNAKGGSEQNINEPPNASIVCIPDLDREKSVAEVEEVSLLL